MGSASNVRGNLSCSRAELIGSSKALKRAFVSSSSVAAVASATSSSQLEGNVA